MNVIEPAVMHLISEERFFAELIMQSRRIYDTKMKHVAAVNVTDTVNFYFNPHMFSQYSLLEQVDILKHECGHIMNEHFNRWKELFPQAFEREGKSFQEMLESHQEFKLGNIAGDLAINEYLPNLPKVFKMVDENGKAVLDKEGNPVTGRAMFVDDWRSQDSSIEKYMHMEYYWEKLKQEQKEQEQKGGKDFLEGKGTIDDHGKWAEGEQNEEFLKEIVKQTVNKAAEATKGAGANIPPQLEKLIQALNYKPKDWRSDLQRFVAKTVNVNRDSTRKKRNRRYGLINPGYKSKEELHLALAIDTSGSMYTELLEQIYSEVNKIHSMGVKVTVIQCDDRVHSVEEFNTKKVPEMNGRGGTAFQPAFDVANEMDIDGLIYFSDMDNFDVDKVVKPAYYPVLWAAPENCTPNYDWGMRTVITVNKK